MASSYNDLRHQEVSMELYRYDGEHCLAVVDGEPVSLVDRSSVVDVVEAVNNMSDTENPHGAETK